MSTGGGLRMVAVGLLGALVVIAPEVAGSQAAPASEAIQAENVGLYGHYWTPSAVKVEPGGSVQISNPTEVPHGVEWIAPPGGQSPSCDPAVPVGNTEAASGKKWSGSCTFTTPGVYTFYCTVHGAAMRGQITVGTVSTTTSTTTTTTQTSPVTTGGGGPPAPEGAGAGSPSFASPLQSDVGHSIELRAARHGAIVYGSLRLSGAGAGMHLEAEVSARRAALTGGSGSVRVGRLERSHLHGVSVSFSIHLNAQARHALHRQGRLTVSIRLLLRPLQGTAISIVRSLTLHA